MAPHFSMAMSKSTVQYFTTFSLFCPTPCDTEAIEVPVLLPVTTLGIHLKFDSKRSRCEVNGHREITNLFSNDFFSRLVYMTRQWPARTPQFGPRVFLVDLRHRDHIDVQRVIHREP